MTAMVRRYAAAVSAEALALAWARQEDGPAGASVVVDHEVSPRGLHGRMWAAPADATLAVAVVLRPAIAVKDADAIWLQAGLVAATATAIVGGPPTRTWWPDRVIAGTPAFELAMAKAEVQLGPGRIRFAVITLRFDLAGIGVDPAEKDALLEAVGDAVGQLRDAEPGDLATRYSADCALVGRDVKLALLPAGQARGRVRAVDRSGRLQLESSTGMVERITVDLLRELWVV